MPRIFCYVEDMDGLLIQVSWEWALGIFVSLSAALIGIAWKASARFTALETSVEWIKTAINDVRINAENNASKTPGFIAHSPVNLTRAGEHWLEESGLKAYIDAHEERFLGACEHKKETNPYEVQQQAFALLDQAAFESHIDDHLKKFAFQQGISMAVLRRVGGIYLRNICLERFGMKTDDIDAHAPTLS